MGCAGRRWSPATPRWARSSRTPRNNCAPCPIGLTYGLLRYLNTDVDLPGADPTIGFNYLGRLGAAAPRCPAICGGSAKTACRSPTAAAAVPMPLAHTVELNAGTVDTDTGPHLHANWTWAPSALDHAQISRLSQLWFDALAGICAHVRHGGGGLTPSDIAPARLSQQQIDELQQQYRIADILPLTPLQQGLLFHASTAQGSDDDLYAMQLDITVDRPARPPPPARCGAHRGQPPPQPGRPILRTVRPAGADHPGRSRSALAVYRAGRGDADVEEQIQRVCAAERAAVCDLADPPAFRAALIRTARRSAPVRADQSPHRARRLVAADPAAGDIRQLLRAAAARGRRRIAGLSPGWPIETSMPPRRPGARCWPASTPPHWSARRAG